MTRKTLLAELRKIDVRQNIDALPPSEVIAKILASQRAPRITPRISR